MDREYKSISTVKEVSEEGQGIAIISTFDVIDKDRDVVRPGAFGEQIAQMIPTHDWGATPIGKATIKENGDKAIAEFKLNLNTSGGKEWYNALKFDLDNPPVKQEYSYGFTVVKESRGEFEGRQVRFLEEVKVHEISPVLVGAGEGTGTLALKSKKKTNIEEDVAHVKESTERLIARVRKLKEMREQDDRELSQDRIKELLDIEQLLIELKQLCEAPKDDESAETVKRFHELETRIFDMKKDAILGKANLTEKK